MSLQITQPIRDLAKRLCAIAITGTIGLLAFAGVAQGAGSATLTLVPASASYHNGDPFTVTIHEYSTDAINAVEADLTYDSTKLQFVSLSTTGSFDLIGPTSGGNGSVKIPVAKSNTSLTGDQVVGTISFTVTSSTPGSTNISFASTSSIRRTSDTADVWNGVTTGSTVTIATASSGGGVTPTPAPSPTAPSTKTKSTTTTSTAPSTTTTTSHPVSSTATTGYLVAIKVTDSSNKPVVGAKVTIEGATFETEPNGIASFNNVAGGSHTVTVQTSTGKTTQTITVDSNGANLQVQQFGIKVAGSRQQNYFWIIALVIALLVISGGGLTLGQALTHRHRAGVTQVTTAQAPAAPAPASGQASPPASGAANALKQVFYPQSSSPANPPNNNSNNQDGTNA